MLTQREIAVLKLRKKGLTQVQVAKTLGISQAAVSKFEQNALAKIRAAKATLTTAKELGVEVKDDA